MINYVSHSLSPTVEPVANLCASGVLERFPGLRFATIEAGIGWLPWLLDAMDEAYQQASLLGAAQAQAPAQRVLPHARLRLVPGGRGRARRWPSATASTDNFMWGNDYPHHEGTWPHSAEAIRADHASGLGEDGPSEDPRPQCRALLQVRGARRARAERKVFPCSRPGPPPSRSISTPPPRTSAWCVRWWDPSGRSTAVIKADGYGHGAAEMGEAFLAAGADALGVADLGEGIRLRRRGITAPILVYPNSLPEAAPEALATGSRRRWWIWTARGPTRRQRGSPATSS